MLNLVLCSSVCWFQALPWSYQETNPNTGEVYWTGYCIDFVQKLSELMDFDYELVTPKNGTFGKRKNGKWDGVVGDLASGVIMSDRDFEDSDYNF